MARNTHTSSSAYLKAVKSTKLYGERRSLDAAEEIAPVPAPVQKLSAPAPKEFIKIMGECRKLLKSAQHQIEILTGWNIALKKDISELMQKESLARHLAYHDELTGLPNRSLLQDRFHQAMSQAKRNHKPLALLMLDLDEFKHVNDKLGHACGDKLLQAVALRLTKGLRGADTACRYGGDEFVIMLPEIDNPEIATTLAAEVCGRLREPYILEDHRIRMAVSVGVAVYPGDGQTLDALMKHADSAMYLNKGTGYTTSIIEQPKEDVGQAELYKPSAPKNADHTRERDSFIQDKLIPVQGQEKKHQQM